MQHSYIDKYSNIESVIHKLDPRIKIISIFFLILCIILTKPTSFVSFGLYLLLVISLIFISGIPPGFILRQSFVIVPFVLMIAVFIPFFKQGKVAGGYSFGTFKLTVTYDGLIIFWNVLIKSFLSILCMILLTASTKFSVFLKALEKMKFPTLFIMILSFMYRYVFVVVDELIKMKQAKESRSVGGSKWFNIKTLANMIGTLFVRAYERGEFVYMAMRSRGFNGSISTLHDFRMKMVDFYFMSIIIFTSVVIKIVAG